jgi:hypothetical protein
VRGNSPARFGGRPRGKEPGHGHLAARPTLYRVTLRPHQTRGRSPHLDAIDDPAVLRAELEVVRTQYNTVRLHEAIGYVTPDDEHEGRGPAIRQARRDGLKRARIERINYHRTHKPPEPGDAD